MPPLGSHHPFLTEYRGISSDMEALAFFLTPQLIHNPHHLDFLEQESCSSPICVPRSHDFTLKEAGLVPPTGLKNSSRALSSLSHEILFPLQCSSLLEGDCQIVKLTLNYLFENLDLCWILICNLESLTWCLSFSSIAAWNPQRVSLPVMSSATLLTGTGCISPKFGLNNPPLPQALLQGDPDSPKGWGECSCFLPCKQAVQWICVTCEVRVWEWYSF